MSNATNSSPAPKSENFFIPFAPLSRGDRDNRIVRGYCYTTARVRGDRYNLKRSALERSAKRYMEMPCIRAMHQQIAAGKALSVSFDDKGCFIEAFISDDKEWQKCVDGVYRGFSVYGHPLIARGMDIEEFDWIETSLVDRPKDAGSLFSVGRVEGTVESVTTIELPEDATDEQVELARCEVSSSYVVPSEESEGDIDESTVSLGPVERGYNPAQPRDGEGKWTIVRGHRVSTTGAAITHDHIHHAVAKFGLGDLAQKKLLQAHADGKLTNDHHLYRAIAHATDAHDTASGVTTGSHNPGPWHWDEAIKAHGHGGTHEEKRTWGAPHADDYKHLTDKELATHLTEKIAEAPVKAHKDLVKGDRVLHGGRLVEITHVKQRKDKPNTVKAHVVHPDSGKLEEGSLHSVSHSSDSFSGANPSTFHIPTSLVMGAAAELRRRKGLSPVKRGEESEPGSQIDGEGVGEASAEAAGDAVERAITSETPGLPVRENLEGEIVRGDYDTESVEAEIDGLIEALWDAYDGEESEPLVRRAVAAALAVLNGDSASASSVARSEGEAIGDNAPNIETTCSVVDNGISNDIEPNPDIVQLVARAESAESELESVRRLADESLSTVRASEESALSRLEAAEATVTELADALKKQEEEIASLRAVPLNASPVRRSESSESTQTGAVAAPRAFAANAMLDTTQSNAARRTALQTEFQELQRSLHTEPSTAKRDAGASRLIVIQDELTRL
jgi:hypothetical protein